MNKTTEQISRYNKSTNQIKLLIFNYNNNKILKPVERKKAISRLDNLLSYLEERGEK